ncbi:hypothetical protein [Stappia sp. ES.058]|uniref:hypothetical protein n=1 Tax=Stappia sp. ES.058 TaxID=1881061 RepID=UPI0012FD9765|nr:hypothetical protein [Stappia sp. ES.058]
MMRVAAIGRGTATTTNLAIMRGARFSSRPVNGRVIDSSGSTLVTSTTVRTGTTINSRSGGIVSRSYRETDELQVHTDRFGNEIGRSYRDTERRTSHFGPHARRRFGFDEITRGGNIIRHFNNARRAEEYLGQTTIESNDGSEFVASADRDLAGSLADISNYRGCPEADRLEDVIERLDKLCRSGESVQCGRISRLNIRFMEALRKCR